jgi:beta-lactamase class A
MPQLTRRIALSGFALLLPTFQARASGTASDDLGALEKSTGARIGVAALDTGNGRTISYRETERFIMCSSFKLSLAAAVLRRAEAGQEKLDRIIHYQKSDLLAVSPATTRNLSTGMTVEALCQAAVVYSDNTAATLLIASIGGPQGVTNFWRSLGDRTSRLDRIEPALNVPDGDKDTTTPSAILGDLKAMLLDDALPFDSRQRLLNWLAASTTGNAMVRAGLPKDWAVGDKTGRYVQEPDNAAIDLAIATPPGRKPILIAAFTMNSRGDDAAHQAVLADIGKIVASRFA